VLVYCEVANGKLANIATELLGAGSRLGGISGSAIKRVLIGSNIGGLASEANRLRANKVFVVDDPQLKD
jgi:electron transfer flavoprotein alpha subunit